MTAIFAFFTSGWMRWALLAIVITAAAAFVREHYINIGRQEILTENLKAAVKIVAKQGAVTERVVTQYVKVAGKTQIVTETVEKEVVKYAEANPGMCLDLEWRRLHDSAASNAVSSPAKQPNDGLRAPRIAASGDSPTDSSPSPANGFLELRAASSLR